MIISLILLGIVIGGCVASFWHSSFRIRHSSFVELPEVTGPRLSAAEVKLALENQGALPAVRALVQLLAMTRADYLKTAAEKAAGEKSATFELGGAQAIEDMLAETLKLIDGQVSDDVKRYFAD